MLRDCREIYLVKLSDTRAQGHAGPSQAFVVLLVGVAAIAAFIYLRLHGYDLNRGVNAEVMKTALHIAMALLVGTAVGYGQDEDKRSEKAESAAKQQRAKIRSELQKLDSHEWAGDYYAGDGLGVNTSLVLAPTSGYIFEWHGCLGLYDRNYGAVASTNNRIRLSFTFENTRKGFRGIAPEFVPVAWGARRYLVPADDVIGFCNHVNGGQEPRMGGPGSYFLRRGDEKKEATGFPKVPDEYRQYLVAKPVEATIIAVGAHTTRPSVCDWKFKDTPVTLDAGTKHGLRVGMKLIVRRPRDFVESVRITSVEEARSEAIMTQIGEDYPAPKVGWRLSTRAPWK